MKNLLFFLFLFLPQILLAARLDCDTIILKNGEKKIVQIGWANKTEFGYRDCGSTETTMFFIKKSSIDIVISENAGFRYGEFFVEEKMPYAERTNLKNKSNGTVIGGLLSGALLTLSAIGFLGNFGLAMALLIGLLGLFAVGLTLFSGFKLLYATRNLPKSRFVHRIRRRAKLGMWLIWLLPILLGILAIYALATWD